MQKIQEKKGEEFSTKEEIKKIVIARLNLLSEGSIKCIGGEGKFTKKEMIKHVADGDEIGAIIQEVEMEWIRGFKSGIINELCSVE